MLLQSTPRRLFISTGDKTAMYTLCAVCDDVELVGDLYITSTNSHYITNLSTDHDRAIEKAKSLAATRGLPLAINADFDLNEIKRVAAGVRVAARERKEREKQERIAEVVRLEAEAVKGKVFLVGTNAGLTAEEIVAKGEEQYVRWYSGQYVAGKERFSAHDATALVALEWVKNNVPVVSSHIGTIGEKITVTLTLWNKRHIQGMYSTTVFVGLTTEGNMVSFFSTAQAFVGLDVNDVFTITGTIKDHNTNEYANGYDVAPDQTIINRPKLVKQ